MPQANTAAKPPATILPDNGAPVQVVLFDYGMVLSGPPDPVAWERIRALAGLDEDRLHDAYWRPRHDYDRGTLTGAAYWNAVAEHAGTRFDAAQTEALLAADVDLWTQLNRPMVEWAQRLQQAGVRTGVLSNIGDHIAGGIRARLPWLTRFDRCIWSHELFLAKPEPEIFARAAAALGAEPRNILFLDDKPENVAAAIAAGMQAIQYGSHAAFEEEMRARGLATLLDVRSGEAADGSHKTADRSSETAAG